MCMHACMCVCGGGGEVCVGVKVHVCSSTDGLWYVLGLLTVMTDIAVTVNKSTCKCW